MANTQKHSRRFSDRRTKFENSAVNRRLAGNPCVNKVKSPPRCGLARMQLFFEVYLRTHFNKTVLSEAGLRFRKKF